MALQQINTTDIATGGALGSIGANNITATYLQTGAIENYMATNGAAWSHRNRIQNGEIMINQRAVANTTANANILNNNFYIDRWSSIHYNTGGSFNPNISIKQTADHPIKGSNGYCLEIQCNSTGTTSNNTDFFSSTHSIEAQNISDIFSGSNAQSMTLSFWVKSNKPGTYCVQMRDNGTGSGGYISIYEYTIVQSGIWEKKTINIPKPSYSTMPGSNINGLTLYFHYASGLTPTYAGQLSNAINTWYNYGSSGCATNNQTNLFTTVGNYHRLTDVQLEIGNVATPYERKPFGVELALCQRYFAKTYRYNTTIGSSGSSYNDGSIITITNTASSTVNPFNWYFPVTMRDAPTVTAYSLSGTSGKCSTSGGLTVYTDQSVMSYYISQTGTAILGTNGSLSGYYCTVHATASSEI